ncbi:S4 domain-containing protein YaaA [Clostridium massiliodielmoense]|uniref:S4 domain-containing protein YaaA n=1 Tax=Clostridium massiliodielmoense TaxID=1776385 RepID=UPI0001663D37|nr:S4 domain-containing protein YaaA [Clostridium massiliodielmoense]EDS76921.1 S4 domain protein YaaA [Clostridium botulinum C str. Eklund]KEH96691.1 RNA-binding protein [Clostridium botulinum C/D str. BKT12695]NEZ48875.1 S4 domain-containing protein YaaA [Clostridium botulinum]
MQEIKISTEFIKLDAFLKWSGIASMGSEAKFYIQNDEVSVNGEVENRRGRKLVIGDIVEINGDAYKII